MIHSRHYIHRLVRFGGSYFGVAPDSHLFTVTWGSNLADAMTSNHWAYILIYLLQESFLWIGVGSKDLVLQLKQQISTRELCTGFAEGFALILEYSCSPAFSKKPEHVLLELYIQDICATLPFPHCKISLSYCLLCLCTDKPLHSLFKSLSLVCSCLTLTSLTSLVSCAASLTTADHLRISTSILKGTAVA